MKMDMGYGGIDSEEEKVEEERSEEEREQDGNRDEDCCPDCEMPWPQCTCV